MSAYDDAFRVWREALQKHLHAVDALGKTELELTSSRGDRGMVLRTLRDTALDFYKAEQAIQEAATTLLRGRGGEQPPVGSRK